MGTESGRGSLTGAAAAPACPSVKARASAASFLPLLSLPPLGPAPGRPESHGAGAPSARQPPTPLPLEFHAPPTAQAQNCLPPASSSGV